MVQLNLALREINCKIVYFGCGLGGKTTNLEVVHQKADDGSRGELTSIATESDRTLFFDFMPLDLGEVSGMKVKFQLYTVPGQVYYNSTRKLVLRGADAVIFVADSQSSKMDENVESLDNLVECLQEQGRSLEEMPHVIQFNKRDLDDIMSVEEMDRVLNRHGAPTHEAVAASGDGVTETFKALAALLLDKVKKMSTDSTSKPDQKARRDAASIRTPGEQKRMTTDRERLQGGVGSERSAIPAPGRLLDRRESLATPRPEPAPAAPSSPHPPLTSGRAAAAAAATLKSEVKPSVRRTTPPGAERAIVSPGTSSASSSIMISTSGRRRRGSPVGAIVGTVITLGALGAAAWYYFLK